MNTMKRKRLIQRFFKDNSLEKFSDMCCLLFSRLLMSISPKRDCPDLNDDIVEKILGRLPLPSLLRAKTVCKAWNAVISSPNFNAEDQRYFVAQVDDENMGLFSSALNRWFEIPLPRCTEGFEHRTCAAEAAGLYLFLQWNTNLRYHSMLVVNPVTKQQRSLPRLPYRWIQIAVELVAHSDHIEIIAFGLRGSDPSYLCALIYSSLTNRWRNVPLRDSIPFRNCCTSVLHNGMVYVMTFSATRLVSYDIKSQEFQFRQIVGRLPERVLNYFAPPSLVSCGGNLLLVVPHVTEDAHQQVGIWELNKDEDDDEWSCSLISIAPHHLIRRSSGTSFEIMAAATSDKIWLTIKECRNLITFDLNSMKWNNVSSDQCPVKCGPGYFLMLRKAFCGTLSIHNKLPLFDSISNVKNP